jgi:ribosome-binding factor A
MTFGKKSSSRRSDRKPRSVDKDPQALALRHQRLQRLIFVELRDILRNEVIDPRLEGFFVTRAELAADFASARVYVAVPPDCSESNRQQAVANLTRISGLFRASLVDALDLKRTPTLRFLLDESLSAEEIQLLRNNEETE